MAGRAFRTGLLLVALFLPTACTTGFLYSQIDHFVVWRVQDYVTLERDQKDWLRKRVQVFLSELRQRELPLLAAQFRAAANELRANKVTVAVIEQRYHAMLELSDDVIGKAVPIAADLLLDLDAEQVEELLESIDEKTEEFYEEYSGETAAEREKNRTRSAIRGMERMTGRLSQEQRDLIYVTLNEMEDASVEWFENQRKWRQAFRDLIVERPEREEYITRLTQLMVEPRSLHSAEYRARVDRNRALLNGMLEELFAGLSERQRNRAVDELEDYAEMAAKLSESVVEAGWQAANQGY